MSPLALRIAALALTAVGTAAGVIAANPDLVSAALPPKAAAAVTAAALVIVAVLHELAHDTTAANAAAEPAAPATPKEPS